MADQPTERLDVGSIGKAHGLRGDVQVRLTTDRTERLDPGSELHTDDRTLVVGSSRPHQNGWLVRFEGVVGQPEAGDRPVKLVVPVVPSAEEEAAFKQPILDQYEAQGHPYYATARLWDDGIIDPVSTRDVLGLGLATALNAPIGEPRFGVFRM